MTGTLSLGLQQANLPEVFSAVYERNVWQRSDTSGPGSSVEATVAYRQYLQEVMRRKRVKKVLDLGCGLWEHLAAVNWTGIEYLGVDPVPSVIARNMTNHQTPQRRFMAGQVEDVPDLASFDLVIIKDVLQHLPNTMILNILSRLRVTRRMLITNDLNHRKFNEDCQVGGWRMLDLERAPFNLVPVEIFDFKSSPFAKRALLVQNGADVSGPA